MIDSRIAYNLAVQRGLRLPLDKEYNSQELEVIAVRLSLAIDEVSKALNDLTDLAHREHPNLFQEQEESEE